MLENWDNKTLAAVRNLSLWLASYALVYGGMYAFAPEYLVRNMTPRTGTPVLVVVWVESIGPVWPFLFFFTAVLVGLSALYRRGVLLAHCIATGVWIFYGACIVAGAILSQPPTPITAGVAAIIGAGSHWFTVKIWAAEGIK